MSRWPRNTLAFRLTGTLILALVLILAAMVAVAVTLQEKFARDCARMNGLSLTEALYGALHSSMLANDRVGLHTEVRNITRASPNLRVRIFNKEGTIMFSSIPGEQGTRLDPRSEACYKCHAADQPIERLHPGERTRTFEVDDTLALGIIKPIENEPACVTAACHAHSEDQRLLGVLDVTLLLLPIERSRRLTAWLMMAIATGVLLLAVGVVVWVVRGAAQRPIGRLIHTLEKVGQGAHGVRHPAEPIAEFGRLGGAVNTMARDLEQVNAELVEWTQTLERRVEAKTNELKQAQEQMIQVERMASLGKLAAVVAHEINNPLASVVTYSKLLLKRLSKQSPAEAQAEENQQILAGIASESARCGEIVSSLLLFARQTASHMKPTDINAIIGRVLFLLKHKMDLASVTAELDLDEQLPLVACDPAQVEQTLVALCVNAIEAMPEGGRLTLRTQTAGPEAVQIEVADTGTGIPEELHAKIFEPFFTTKDDDGSPGLGLGLAVVYGIVQRHGGSIVVQSRSAAGTRFTISLPTERAQEPNNDS